MKLDIQYRETSYFNTEDSYLCYDGSIKRLLVTKLEKKGDSWYTIESLKYKASSIRLINFKEVHRKRISLKNIEYTGTITKVLEPDNIGIIWDSGKQVKDNGLANFWTEWHKLDFVYG